MTYMEYLPIILILGVKIFMLYHPIQTYEVISSRDKRSASFKTLNFYFGFKFFYDLIMIFSGQTFMFVCLVLFNLLQPSRIKFVNYIAYNIITLSWYAIIFYFGYVLHISFFKYCFL